MTTESTAPARPRSRAKTAPSGPAAGDQVSFSSGVASGWSFTLKGSIEVPSAKPEPQWRVERGTGPEGTAGLWLWCYPAKGAPRPVWRVPVVASRVNQRDGEGRKVGRLYLVTADDREDSPRELISEQAIVTGRAGFGVSLPPPPDRTLRELIATAVVVQPCDTETEQVPRVDPDTGRYPALDPDVLPSGYGAVAPGGAEEGLTAWRKAAPLIASHPRIALILGMSAFAPFVSPLDRQPRVVNATGAARQGKTTTLYLGAAVWGNPGRKGGRQIVQSWNASAQGLPQFLGRLGIMPGYFDEQGSGDPRAAEMMRSVYSMVEGNSRRMGTVDGIGRVTAGWAGVVLSSSNASMLDRVQTTGAGAGIPARLIEVGTPFTSSETAAAELDDLAHGAYGHVGRAILARFSAEDAGALVSWARERMPIPEDATVSRTIREHWHDAVAGAAMVDTVLGTGTLIQDAAIRAARELTEGLSEPEHDAQVFLAELRERMASDPAAWPTQTMYAEWHKPRPAVSLGGGLADPARRELPQHGVRSVAGIVGDDGSWVAVLPAAWREIMAVHGTDSGMVCEWLYRRGLLTVAESYRREGKWQTPVKAAGKPVKAYRVELREDPAAEDATEPHTAPAPPAPVPALSPMLDVWITALRSCETRTELDDLGAEVRRDAEADGLGAPELARLREVYGECAARLRPAPIPEPRQAEPVSPAIPAALAGAESLTSESAETQPAAGVGRTQPGQGVSGANGATYRQGRRRPSRITLDYLAAVYLAEDAGELAADVDGLGTVPADTAGLIRFVIEHGPRMHVAPINGGRGSDGMIVLDAEAARSIGLGAEDWTRELTSPAGDAGLTVGKPSAVHVKLWRNASGDTPGISVTVVNMARFEELAAAGGAALRRVDLWATYAERDGRPDGAQLARLVRSEASSRIGDVPFAASSGAGLRLWEEVNPREVWADGPDGKRVRSVRPDALPDNPVPAPVAAGKRHPFTLAQIRAGQGVCADEDYTVWARELTPEESARPFVVALDRCLAFLAGARDLKVPVGMLQPVESYTGTGIFRADLRGLRVESDLPHFATSDGTEPTGPGWYTSVTIDYAARQYGYDTAAITEGYSTTHTAAAFTGYSERVRDAYLSAMAEAGVSADAEGEEFLAQYLAAAGDGLILAKGRKRRYKGLFGRLTDGADYLRDDSEWLENVASKWHYRPDIRFFVVSAARIGTHRMIATARKLSGRAPVALNVDCVLYSAGSPDPRELATFSSTGRPSGIRLGIRPGYCKPQSAIPTGAYLAAPGKGLSLSKLIHSFDVSGVALDDPEGADDAE